MMITFNSAYLANTGIKDRNNLVQYNLTLSLKSRVVSKSVPSIRNLTNVSFDIPNRSALAVRKFVICAEKLFMINVFEIAVQPLDYKI